MSFTFYDGSIVAAKDALISLSSILEKAAAHSDAANLPTARLYEDMKPLSFQVFIVTNIAAKIISHTTGVPVPGPVCEESDLGTIEAMQKRTAAVQDMFPGVDKDLVNRRVDEMITLELGPLTAQVRCVDFVQGYAVPNMMFHLVTAYDILRNQGLPMVKQDYLTIYLRKCIPDF